MRYNTIRFDIMASKFVQVDGLKISFLKNLIEEKRYEFFTFAFCEITNCDLSEITNYIVTNQIDIKNGDVVVFFDPHDLYRNAGKCIWYDGRAIHLSHECDEYGEVPKCFEIAPNTFHPRYWMKTIAHNINYWPCDDYRAQCCNNMTLSENNIRYTWFFHNDHKEYVVDYSEHRLSSVEFEELLLDRSKPYDGYCMYCIDEYFLDDMNHTNTSMVCKITAHTDCRCGGEYQ